MRAHFQIDIRRIIVEYEGRNLGECFEMFSEVIENSTNSFRTLLLLMQMFKSQLKKLFLWLFIEKKKKIIFFRRNRI